MTKVVVHREIDFFQLDRMASRVFSALGNVSTSANQYWVLEEIIRAAVLLKDHHDVLNLSRSQYLHSAASGIATEAHESASRDQHHHCEKQ
jgi:hypothetical protein